MTGVEFIWTSRSAHAAMGSRVRRWERHVGSFPGLLHFTCAGILLEASMR
jgi:hypothetical protein